MTTPHVREHTSNLHRYLIVLAAVVVFTAIAASVGVAGAQGIGLDLTSEEAIVATRQPLPENTPSPLARQIADAAIRGGYADNTVFGRSLDVWVDIAISVVIVILGFIIGEWLLRLLMQMVTRRTATELDNQLRVAVGRELRWLVLIVASYIATARLSVLNATTKRIALDICFVAALYVIVVAFWRAIEVTEQWYRHRVDEEQRLTEVEPAIILATRIGRVTLAVLGLSTLLAHFGVNVPALAAAVGLSGLALSLAAKDTISDGIAGIIILFDRPFRTGDRIEIEGIDTWGDVVNIGLRTTRIRTRDNRLVIVPNSMIGSNQIVNYTYPDPRYRIQVHVQVGYGTDIDAACTVLEDAVRQVGGVLQDMPVEALYLDMGESAMVFRVRWWIESYEDTRRMFHRVNRALQHAMEEHDIDQPYPISATQLQVDRDTIASVRDAFKGD